MNITRLSNALPCTLVAVVQWRACWMWINLRNGMTLRKTDVTLI